MVMPFGGQFWGANLSAAVTNGSVPLGRLDDMVTRIIATWYKMRQDQGYPEPGIGMPRDLTQPHAQVIGNPNNTQELLFKGAVEGHVLLKNTENALPLKKPRVLSIFGYSAKAADTYAPGSGGWNDGSYPLAASDSVSVDGQRQHSQIAANGTLITGGGSGANQPMYAASPFEALNVRARRDGTKLWWDFHSENPRVDANSDACLIFGNAYASEGWDRSGLHDDFTDNLILNVASKCRNTIVIFHNAGIRLVDNFVEHENVTGLLFAHLPGQESGYATASILYGESYPSGKLPYTVARNESDYGELARPSASSVAPGTPQDNFMERTYIDYRAFDAKNITPRYEFGFGLSYTNFTYEGIKASASATANLSAPYASAPVFEGGRRDLWDIVAYISADVRNTGAAVGAEVVQLYLGIPGGPPKVLRGFEKAVLLPGQSATVTFDVTRRDMSTWDTTAQEWLLQNGTFNVYVGGSSRNLPLQTSITIRR
jgi:beta-glucosidase